VKVFVTGANGHIGANVVRELLRLEYQPVCYVRPGADLRGIDGLHVEVLMGGLFVPERIMEAMQGCESVIHLAAPFHMIASSPQEIIQPAVEGTRNVLLAAAGNGIRRIVYASSVVAIGPADSPDETRSEADWFDTAEVPYYVAKTESEKLAHRVSREMDLELVSLLPAAVLGPHDYKPTPSTTYLGHYIEGTVPLPAGGSSFVDVRDVAQAFATALTQGRPGVRYILSGPNINNRDLVGLLEEITTLKPTYLSLPRWLLMAYARVYAGVEKALRRPQTLDPKVAGSSIERYWHFDNENAKADLGFEARPTRNVLEDAVRWMVQCRFLASETVDKLPEAMKTPISLSMPGG
jgi:dihydroflavonol-4-reductase